MVNVQNTTHISLNQDLCVHEYVNEIKTRCTYNVTLRLVRATIVGE
jgi:hypothetical protein